MSQNKDRCKYFLNCILRMHPWAITGKRGPLVLQTLYAPVQGKARAKKWEWVGREAGCREGIGNFRDSIGNLYVYEENI
jgi:hypothetical protein